jgi:pantoate--beta-alanine ligase
MQQQAFNWLKSGDEIGFVPTMGALHAGHDALVERARRENRRVVASIFVNPRQFGPQEDFHRYPRPIEADRARLEALGVDAVFHPPVEQIYPPAFRSSIDPGPLGTVLEGASRPGHFAGVLTVVLKLFEIVRPTRAYFGQKDFQQVVLIRQLVRDFSLPVRVVGCPTVREPDGLAMSSRNAYLDPGQRQVAPVIRRALAAAAGQFVEGERDPARLEASVRATLSEAAGAEIDYVSVIEESTLSRTELAQPGNIVVVAVKLGTTRLIDNVVLGAESF